MSRLSLYDFRDLDLMLAVADAVDDDGNISTGDLAGALGLDDDRMAVATRMAWMRRYGVFDFDQKKRLWSMTAGGGRVLAARKQASKVAVIDKIPDESLVEAMAHITARYRLGDALNATLLRREFAFGTSPRSAAYNGRPG